MFQKMSSLFRERKKGIAVGELGDSSNFRLSTKINSLRRFFSVIVVGLRFAQNGVLFVFRQPLVSPSYLILLDEERKPSGRTVQSRDRLEPYPLAEYKPQDILLLKFARRGGRCPAVPLISRLEVRGLRGPFAGCIGLRANSDDHSDSFTRRSTGRPLLEMKGWNDWLPLTSSFDTCLSPRFRFLQTQSQKKPVFLSYILCDPRRCCLHHLSLR